jgi:hypothetical protein
MSGKAKLDRAILVSAGAVGRGKTGLVGRAKWLRFIFQLPEISGRRGGSGIATNALA